MPSGRVRLIEADIRDRGLMEELVSHSDLVFHMAALRITQCAENPRHAMEVMADATFDLLELCVKHKVEKVIAASSASVYGMAEQFPTTESHHPYNNWTLYGAAKVFNEGLLRSFHHMYGLNYAAMRYFNVYGPRMDIHGVYTEVLIRWMERIDRGAAAGDLRRRPPDHGLRLHRGRRPSQRPGRQGRRHRRGLQRRERHRDQPQTARRDALKVMGGTSELEFQPARKVNPVQRRLADVEKARRLIGFEASVPLDEGLERLVAWWKSQ